MENDKDLMDLDNKSFEEDIALKKEKKQRQIVNIFIIFTNITFSIIINFNS